MISVLSNSDSCEVFMLRANVSTMGWTIVTTPYWENLWGYSSLGQSYFYFGRPGDLQLRVVQQIFNVNDVDQLSGAVLVYADNHRGIRMLPFEDTITSSGGFSATIEHRFVYRERSIVMVVALRAGTWNIDYIMNTYLPSIKWKVVMIPELLANAQADALSKLNLTNYNAVSSHFNLKD